MMNFLRGGRGLSYGQSDHVNVLTSYQDRSGRPKEENNRYRLLLPLGRYSRSKFGTLRSDVMFMIFCVLFSGYLVSPAFGQETEGLDKVKPLMIGQRVPDGFWTKEHLFYVNGDTVRKTLKEYKGKMLVLGFWASWCSSCLQHQKTIDNYLMQYGDKLAVVKVNSIRTKDSFSSIRRAIAGILGVHNNLDSNNFLSIIEDSYLLHTFPHDAYPHYVWINKNGIVQTFTYRNLLDPKYKAPYVD